MIKSAGNIPPVKEVNIPIQLYKSLQGKYFLGQTGTFTFGAGNNAWGGLFNPSYSGKILYVNVLAITNYSGSPLKAQIWFNTYPPGTESVIFGKVAPSNTALSVLPESKSKIKFNPSVSGHPTGGMNPFNRDVGPYSTQRTEEDGKLIFPPGGSIIVFLPNPGTEKLMANLAFGWWEENV